MSAPIVGYRASDERFNRRWFPRELRVRIEVTATAPDDRFLSHDVHAAVAWIIGQEIFQQGAYPSGLELEHHGVRIRLTFRNWYGPTSGWRIVNRIARWWDRSLIGWRLRQWM